jgi:hypothetical protein
MVAPHAVRLKATRCTGAPRAALTRAARGALEISAGTKKRPFLAEQRNVGFMGFCSTPHCERREAIHLHRHAGRAVRAGRQVVHAGIRRHDEGRGVTRGG